jgi:hypothetical protein
VQAEVRRRRRRCFHCLQRWQTTSLSDGRQLSNSERRFLLIFNFIFPDFIFILFFIFLGFLFCFVWGRSAREHSFFVCLSVWADRWPLCWFLQARNSDESLLVAGFLVFSPTSRPSFFTRCFFRFCGLAILEGDIFGGAKLWRVFFKSGRFAAIFLQDFVLKIFFLPENGELVNRRVKREERRNGTEEEKEL